MENNTNSEVTSATTIDHAAPDQLTAVAPQPPQKKRSPRLFIGGIIAAALIVLGGSGALAYTLYYQNPDKVVHDAMLNILKAKTATTTGTLTYKDTGVTVDIALDAKSNQKEGEFNINAKVALDTEQMKQDFEAGGSGRIIGDTFYFKLNGVKEVAEDVMNESQDSLPPYAADIIGKIDNRWISVKASDYQDLYEDLARQQTCFMELSEKMQSDKAMTDEITNLYSSNRIVTVKEELGSKNVRSVGSLGYKIDINQDATVAFVRGLENTRLGSELKNCDESIDYTKMADDLAEETEDTEYTPTIELWVSRFGHEVTELVVHGDTSDSGNLSIALQPIFNNEVTVETPADAASFETVMEDIRTIINEYSASEPAFEDGIMPLDADYQGDIDYSVV